MPDLDVRRQAVCGRIVHQLLQMFIHCEQLLIITQSKRLIGDDQAVLQVVIELFRVSLECAEDQNIAKLHDRKKYAEQYPHAWRRCEVQTGIICEQHHCNACNWNTQIARENLPIHAGGGSDRGLLIQAADQIGQELQCKYLPRNRGQIRNTAGMKKVCRQIQ